MTFYLRAFADPRSAPGARQIPGEVQRLFQIAIKETQTYDATRGRATREQTTRFEAAVDELASADKWTVRLSSFLETLRTSGARTALKKLVKLGCVPDMLVDCLNERRDEETSRRVHTARLNAHRKQMKTVAKQMCRLARLCADEDRQHLPVVGAYSLDWKIPRFLRNEARRINAFVVASDPRKNHSMTPAEHSLFTTMQDIRRITGKYQDHLVADFLSSVFPTSADDLRKFRSRKSALWTVKRPLPRVETDDFPKLVDGLKTGS